MKKLLALLLTFALILGYTACSKPKDDPTPEPPSNSEDNGGKNPTSTLTVAVPEYKDYGRGTVNFDKLVYSRPNMQLLINSFDEVRALVEENAVSVTEQIDAILKLEAPLSEVKTMYSLSEIYNNKDSSVEYWQGEYEYISTNYPRISKAVEDLLVACAKSSNRAEFENNYFGYSLEKYTDGGIYSDEVVALMAEEARMESEYASLSTANVEIEYNGVDSSIRWKGTVDEVIAMAQEHFKYDEASFERCLMAIDTYYIAARQKIENPLFVELIKIRRLIADELGYEDYHVLGYESMGYDYSAEQMRSMLQSIGRYTSPVAKELEYILFYSYFTTNVQPRVNKIAMINTLYELYSKLGGDYKDAYSYMLQHGLYDIADEKSNRYNGAFTTYIDNNASPYLFMTASGFIRDYTTLAHEFGHFLDGYINNGVDASLTVSEISSQALELLTLTRLKNNIPAKNYEYLEYFTLYSFINSVLLTQSFYASFEHAVYQLEYDEINEEKLIEVIEDAYTEIFGEDTDMEFDLNIVTIPHTFLYPFYVESYVASALVSLEIFFIESDGSENIGEGFAIYESLIRRGTEELGFIEHLESVGLESPFHSSKVKEISDSIYFHIIGKHYYKESENNSNAA